MYAWRASEIEEAAVNSKADVDTLFKVYGLVLKYHAKEYAEQHGRKSTSLFHTVFNLEGCGEAIFMSDLADLIFV